MKPAVGRLVLTASLFLCWIGYLYYLWQTSLFFRPSGEPLVVSVPQVLSADAVVEAEIAGLGDPVTVKAVLWPAENSPVQVGDTFTLSNLNDCRRLQTRASGPPPSDFTGPGVYLVPVHLKKDEPFVRRLFQPLDVEVAKTPPSPAYLLENGPPRIYPAIDQTRAQLQRIVR